jgi:hypothetical protein
VDIVQSWLPPLDVTILSMRSLVERLDPPSASTTWKIQLSNPVVLKLRASPGLGFAAKSMIKIKRGVIFLQFLS